MKSDHFQCLHSSCVSFAPLKERKKLQKHYQRVASNFKKRSNCAGALTVHQKQRMMQLADRPSQKKNQLRKGDGKCLSENTVTKRTTASTIALSTS